MSTLDWMTPQQLQDLRDAGRGHLIDGAGPLLDKADELRKRERGDFDHWQSFSLGDLGAAIHNARTALSKASQQQGSPQAPVAPD